MLHRDSTPGAPPVPGARISPRGVQLPSAAPVSVASCSRLTGMRPGGSGRSATTRGTIPARSVSSIVQSRSSDRFGRMKMNREGSARCSIPSGFRFTGIHAG